jgi:SNF family Na+-dependent transporter
MELTAAVTILVAVVAPFVIAVITRPTWTPDQKRNTAIIVAVVLGVIVAVATGRVEQIPATVTSWLAQGIIVVGVVVSLAQGFYQALKGTLTKVEAATSPTPAPVVPGVVIASSPAIEVAVPAVAVPAAVVPDVTPAAAVPTATTTVIPTGATVFDPADGTPPTTTLS